MKKNTTFKIESLFDKRGRYTGHYSKKTGDLLFHSYNGA